MKLTVLCPSDVSCSPDTVERGVKECDPLVSISMCSQKDGGHTWSDAPESHSMCILVPPLLEMLWSTCASSVGVKRAPSSMSCKCASVDVEVVVPDDDADEICAITSGSGSPC